MRSQHLLLPPPNRNTRPDNVISPVIARIRPAACLYSDANADVIVTPALGPILRYRARRHVQVNAKLLEDLGSIPNSTACDHRYDCAARADSCITSPSWPVIVSPRPPGSSVASINKTSPPISVHAIPVATPAGNSLRASSG